MHPKTKHEYVIQIRLDGKWRDVLSASTEQRAKDFKSMMAMDHPTRLLSRTITISIEDEVIETK